MLLLSAIVSFVHDVTCLRVYIPQAPRTSPTNASPQNNSSVGEMNLLDLPFDIPSVEPGRCGRCPSSIPHIQSLIAMPHTLLVPPGDR
jgi:hypothetical protein